jgi:integrase
MKIKLTVEDLKTLHISKQPPKTGGASIADFIANPDETPYYIWDTKTTGFGVYVGRKGLSFVVQVRDKYKKLRKVTIGPMAKKDTPGLTLEKARTQAKQTIAQLKGLGLPTAAEQRDERDILAQTLKQVMQGYLKKYEARARPRKNTVLNIEAAMRRIGQDLLNKSLGDLTVKDLKDRWEATKEHRTSAEQWVRWGHRAIRNAMEQEAHDKAGANNPPLVLQYNPFKALLPELRTTAEVKEAAKTAGLINPLNDPDALALWMKGLQKRRARNPQAGDYLLLTVLTGCRRGELTRLKWSDRFPVDEKSQSNFARIPKDPGAPWTLELYLTKNGQHLVLPLGEVASSIIRERYRQRKAGESYVFPRVKPKANQVEHYDDPRSFLESVNVATAEMANEAGLAHLFRWKDRERRGKAETVLYLGMHDLRRTFATVGASLVPELALKKLLNHAGGVTGRYVGLGEAAMRAHMQTIEDGILASSLSCVT